MPHHNTLITPLFFPCRWAQLIPDYLSFGRCNVLSGTDLDHLLSMNKNILQLFYDRMWNGWAKENLAMCS